MKNSIWQLILGLILAHFLRDFFFPEVTGILSISLHAYLMIIIISLFYIPWFRKIKISKAIRDTLIIFGINLSGSVCIVFLYPFVTNESMPTPFVLIVFTIIFISLGFSIIGYISIENKLTHMAYTAIFLWLLIGMQIFFDTVRWKSWLLTFFYLFFGMWVGYFISDFMKKLIDKKKYI